MLVLLSYSHATQRQRISSILRCISRTSAYAEGVPDSTPLRPCAWITFTSKRSTAASILSLLSDSSNKFYKLFSMKTTLCFFPIFNIAARQVEQLSISAVFVGWYSAISPIVDLQFPEVRLPWLIRFPFTAVAYNLVNRKQLVVFDNCGARCSQSVASLVHHFKWKPLYILSSHWRPLSRCGRLVLRCLLSAVGWRMEVRT